MACPMNDTVDSNIVSPPTVSDVCRGAIEQWKAMHCPKGDFERETMMVTARVGSWISARSVLAGVRDVFSASRPEGTALPQEVITVLADELARQLMEEGMLIAQARRSGPLG